MKRESLSGKKMRRALLLTVGALMLCALAAGCSTVVTRQPLRSTPEPALAERLEGVWQADDGVIHVKSTGGATAQIGTLEWRDGGFRLDGGDLTLSESRGRSFVSLRYQEGGRWLEDFFFAQYSLVDDDYLVIWTPLAESFAAAASAGTIAAEVTDGDSGKTITLTGASDRILEFIADPKRVDLFDYQDPIILRRIIRGKPDPRGRKPATEEQNR